MHGLAGDTRIAVQVKISEKSLGFALFWEEALELELELELDAAAAASASACAEMINFDAHFWVTLHGCMQVD